MEPYILVVVAALASAAVLAHQRRLLRRIDADLARFPPPEPWPRSQAFYGADPRRRGGDVALVELRSASNPWARYEIRWLPATAELVAFRRAAAPDPAVLLYGGAVRTSVLFLDELPGAAGVTAGVRVLVTGPMELVADRAGPWPSLARCPDGWEQLVGRLQG